MPADFKKRRIKTAALMSALLISALVSAATSAAPRSEAEPPHTRPVSAVGESAAAQSSARTAGRRSGTYTLILAGLDEVSGNTDTIILASIDAERRSMSFVNIPRDTYVNHAWEVRKINCVYTGTKNSGGSGIEGLRDAVRTLTGYDADCCVVVSLGTVEKAIDMVGGIYFDVPFDMDYEDAEQGLSIHIPAGYRLLDGESCMKLCRYRKDYVNGDIDRISLQQSFMRAALKQFASIGSIPQLARVARLVAAETDSDLNAANVAFLLRCALQCRAGDVGFYTMPNRPADAGGLSYTFVEPEPWLELLNERFDPFDAEIRLENLDAVYIEDGVFRSSSGHIRGEDYLYR